MTTHRLRGPTQEFWATDRLLDRHAGAGQRAVRLILEADLAVGEQFGGVMLAHVVGFEPATRRQASTF